MNHYLAASMSAEPHCGSSDPECARADTAAPELCEALHDCVQWLELFPAPGKAVLRAVGRARAVLKKVGYAGKVNP